MTPREKFVGLIKNEILRMDLAELDFGIYRILNHRRQSVEAYLREELPRRIETRLKALGEGENQAKADEENRVYAALTTFFSRYFEDGDFVMKSRRGREAAYSVPYNGEDVHFHWATKGSHYVKSGLHFSFYRAVLDHGEKIAFGIDRAELPKDNNKAKDARYFVPLRYEFVAAENEHRVTFAFRALDEKESRRYARKGKDVPAGSADDGEAAETVEGRDPQERIFNAWLAGEDFKAAKIPPSNLDPDKLRPHVRRFAKKHNADFFVHPQLKTFLDGELDWFLKNEFLAIWDKDGIGLVREREKFKIARDIGQSLIAFLAEIEDFQAALFEKRRFVTGTRYLVMASAVPEPLRDAACANAAQVAEWGWWVGENKDYDPLKAEPLSRARERGGGEGGGKRGSNAKFNATLGQSLLARYPHLPIHTKHFDDAFTLALLGEFSDLDAATGGLLVYGENYGALRTLEPTYKGQVKCIYIDPPYNTGVDDFLYKDDFSQHSSWLSMMYPRLTSGRGLLAIDGALFASYDDVEEHRFRSVADEVFDDTNRVATFVRKRRLPSGMRTNPISPDHEYVGCYARDQSKLSVLGFKLNEADYPLEDEHSRYRSTDLTVGMGRDLRPNQYYKIANPKTGKTFAPPEDRVWRFEPGRMGDEISEGNIIWPDDIRDSRMERPRFKTRLDAQATETGERPVSTWIDANGSDGGALQASDGYIAGLNTEGTRDLKKLFGANPASYPKPTSLIENLLYVADTASKRCLDFFAGSGTTGHAVINLNREDGGQRKFMLVEMGEYFDSVLLPRIAKVMAAPEWKDGKPKDGVVFEAGEDDDHWSRRTLPIVKVLALESYEDSLDAIALPAGDAPSLLAADDDSVIRYVLGAARGEGEAMQNVRVNTTSFDRPFDYRLQVNDPGREKTLTVDLAETACLMLGLATVRVREVRRTVGKDSLRYRLVEGWMVQQGNKLALMVLRDYVAPADAHAAKVEYDWLAETVTREFGHPLGEYATVYFNRDLMLFGGEKGECLDIIVKRRMLERA